ncbi:MAG: alpha/beta fold hydrolase [Deltaproteobacteria bacterium]|nr:alpha/beta fold hydrolase [Deltaproteobacteria bacterium]
MNQINVTFASNGFLLKGMLHLPETNLPPVVIGSHGLLSNSYSPKQIALARECNAHGIAYFRFDHRGCGQSDGVFNEITSLNGRRNDLINAVNTIQMRKDIGKRIGLFGSSMGGTVCISVADILDIDVWVTYASPVRSSSVTTSLKKSDDTEKIKPWDISDQLEHLHHIFILHGDSDTIVPPANAHEIYTKSGNPKKLIIQKGGNHRMSNKKHQKDFLREAVNWFKECLIG